MLRFSQIAAPAVVGIGLLVGGAGCASDRPDAVPSDADIVATGTKDVKTTAAQDGTVYVYDETADKMVYTGKVERGDTVRVDAKKNRVLFNDKPAVERDLIDDHEYKVYFDRDPRGNDPAVIRHRDGTTVIQPQSGTSGGNVIVQPAQPGGTTVVQPAQPSGGGSVMVQPAQPSGSIMVQPAQPGGATVIQPAQPGGGGSVTVQPAPGSGGNAITVQPAQGSSGTTVVQPSR